MPLEESGNMLTLAAMICIIDGNTDWVDTYWRVCRTWATYLSNNGQDPAEQLCTDDFAGHWAHNANLSIKAIMGVAAYALIAHMKGQESTYETYMEKARKMAAQWMQDADDGNHYRLAFDREGTWSQKYNLVWDKLWGLELFPGVAQKEISYYRSKQNTYGLPLDSRSVYTKSDWIMWTASMADTKRVFQSFADPVYNWAHRTTTRWPLSDWYYTDGPTAVGFRARSVSGGFWMKILMDRYAGGIAVGLNEVEGAHGANEANGTHETHYDLSGRVVDPTTPGVHILRRADGTTAKVLVR